MPGAVDAVMTFGGYADLDAALRFCLDGEMQTASGSVSLKRDPLNAPVLFLNLLPYLDLGDTHALERALRELAFRTWGRPALKLPGARDSVAYALAQRLPREQRALFLLASGLLSDLDGMTARQWLDQGLERAGGELDFARPGAAIERSTRPCVILHGKEDDVIPWGESVKLHAELSRRASCDLFITGLFAHTQAEPIGLRSVKKELSALLGMARAMAHGGQVAAWVAAQSAR
jgi:pimeloyl-ACP methyl ester carboxylesterase